MNRTPVVAVWVAVVLVAGVVAAGAQEPAISEVRAAHTAGPLASHDPGEEARPLTEASTPTTPPTGTPTTAPPQTATTESPESPDTTTTSAPPAEEAPPLCDPSVVAVETVTDKTAYAPGEPVAFLSTVTNLSGGDCYYPAFTSDEIVHESGWSGGTWRTAAHPYDTNRWPAGETLTKRASWNQAGWTEGDPDGDPASVKKESAPPGRYTVTVTWTASMPGDTGDTGSRHMAYTATANFEIIAG